MDKLVGYKKTYKMRRPIKGKRYISIGLPWEVVQREASIRGLTVEQFTAAYVVEAEYNGSDGVRYRFKSSEDERGTT